MNRDSKVKKKTSNGERDKRIYFRDVLITIMLTY